MLFVAGRLSSLQQCDKENRHANADVRVRPDDTIQCLS